MNEGSVVDEGTPQDVVNSYLSALFKLADGRTFKHDLRQSPPTSVYGEEISIVTDTKPHVVPVGNKFVLNIVTRSELDDSVSVVVRVQIRNYMNSPVLVLSNNQTQQEIILHHGKNIISLDIEHLPLIPGRYTIKYTIWDEQLQLLDRVNDALSFEIVPADFFSVGSIPRKNRGVFFQKHNWSSTIPNF